MSYSAAPSWECATLGSVASFINGYPFAPDEHEHSGLPVIRIEQLKDREAPSDKSSAKLPDRFMLRNDDIVFSWSGSFVVQLWDRGPAWLNQHLFRVIPKGLVDNRFLAHLLNWSIDPISRQSHGTTMTHITRRALLAHRVLIPPLDEQRRIAEILGSLDSQIQASCGLVEKHKDLRIGSIRQLMDAGLQCFRGIETSELHAGGRRSHGTWSLVPLESVLTGIDAGHSPDLEDTSAGPGQWGVLKVSAIGDGEFHPEENKVAPDQGLHNPAICVRAGDLLMTRANTSQLVGRSCIVDSTPPGLMLCDKTLRLKVAAQLVPVRYVQIVLGLAEVRRQIEIAATGTSASMKNISQQSIRKLMIPIADPNDVNRIVEIDTLFETKISAMRREVERLRLVKLGLMDDLLTGKVRVLASGIECMGTG
jgi:type I restriction enzyme S subunit